MSSVCAQTHLVFIALECCRDFFFFILLFFRQDVFFLTFIFSCVTFNSNQVPRSCFRKREADVHCWVAAGVRLVVSMN